jgi:hypothetical protein
MTVGAGGIWISDRNGLTLLRVDPMTGQINRRVRLSTLGLRTPEPNMGIAIDGGSLWVARGAEAVDRLNPFSLKLQRRITLGQRGCGFDAGQCTVMAGGGRIWVAGGDGGWLAKIDEATNRVAIIKGLHPYLCCVAYGGGSVWVAEVHDIARLSPHGRVLRRYPFTSDGIGDISFDGGSLWASADSTGQLLRIDARTGRLSSIQLGNLLLTSAFAAHGIVAVTAMSRPTIPTRAGFRFSPPLNRAVTAEDVRATLVRAVSPALGPTAPASSVLREVVGLAAYRHGRADDVSGIGVHHGILQITTRRPVRDLPARLALPYFCVLPAGTPAPPSGYGEPLPTAGPYYLAEHSGGSLALLRPNPGYRGTRPRHLSAIVFRINVAIRAGVARVRNGQLDYYDASTSGALRPVTVGQSVGCRNRLPGVPGLDLATLCRVPAVG